MEKLEFLKKNVFFCLENLNDGFDSESIYYFSETDFEIVLNRVKNLGLGIWGIETWYKGEFFDVKGFKDYTTFSTDSNWYFKAFEEFKETKLNLQYSASFEIINP